MTDPKNSHFGSLGREWATRCSVGYLRRKSESRRTKIAAVHVDYPVVTRSCPVSAAPMLPEHSTGSLTPIPTRPGTLPTEREL